MLPPKKEHVEGLDWIRFVEGYDGDYAVTRCGKVVSYKREMPIWLKMTPGSTGYPSVRLYGSDAIRAHSVHQLVATTFIGPRPDGMEVCHCDGSRDNNHVENLRYDSRAANSADRFAHDTHCRGERNGYSKLTSLDVREIRRRRALGVKLSELAGDFDVGIAAIHKVVTRRTWRHIED
jgi:hypothetical protein